VALLSQAASEIANESRHNNASRRHDPLPELPPHDGFERTTAAGKRTLWITFIIMAITSFLILAMTMRQQAKNRIFHHISFFITTCSAISYYAMATGGGVSYVIEPGHKAIREIFWARYVDQAITMPLLLLNLTLLAGVAGADIVVIILADIGMVLTSLFAALDDHVRTKWGFFVFSCLFFLFILYSLLNTGRKTAYMRSNNVGRFYASIVIYTTIIWIMYPIAWALAEGTNRLSANQAVLFYAILDILAKPVFVMYFLIAHMSIAESNVTLPMSWTEPRPAAGGYGTISGRDIDSPHNGVA
jgi:bacteriorhodopsin